MYVYCIIKILVLVKLYYQHKSTYGEKFNVVKILIFNIVILKIYDLY